MVFPGPGQAGLGTGVQGTGGHTSKIQKEGLQVKLGRGLDDSFPETLREGQRLIQNITKLHLPPLSRQTQGPRVISKWKNLILDIMMAPLMSPSSSIFEL